MQLLLPRRFRSLETLWATEVPHGGNVGGVESQDVPCPQVKPQISRLLNPCENPPPSTGKPKPLRNLLHNSVTNKLLTSPPFPSWTSLWPLYLCSLSPQGFLTEVKPPPQHSVPSEKPLCLSAANFTQIFDLPAPARWDTAGSLSSARAAGMIHAMPELQPDLEGEL